MGAHAGMKLRIKGEDMEGVDFLRDANMGKDWKDLGKSLGLTLSYASFLAGDGTGVITTEKQAVALAREV
mgnify:CR=1 FL=1